MNRSEQLKFCQQCLNRKFDRDHGIVCGLTGFVADFEETCGDFKQDTGVLARETAAYSPAPVNNSRANKDMLWGAVWCIGGIIGTVADTGYIFWGAIVFGGIQFFVGLSNAGR